MKTMIKIVVVAMATGLVVGAVLSVQGPSVIKPGSVYQLVGVTITSPNQPGWELLKSDQREVIFRKQNSDRTCLARVTIAKSDIPADSSDPLAALEARKTEELKTRNVDHLHFDKVGSPSGPILRYDSIIKVEGPSAAHSNYFNFSGWLCPHMGHWNYVVEIEFSDHSNSRGFTEDLIALVDEFYRGVSLSKSPN